MTTIGERIKELRKKAGMTQEQVANAVGKSKGNISGYENGTFEPSAETIVGLAECFKISTDYILLGIDTNFFSNSLSEDENELLENYRKLSPRAKHMLHMAIYDDLDLQSGKLPPNKTAAG